MPDPTSRIRFISVFPKKAWATLCETDLDPIWMAWSGFGQTHLVWKQAGVQESSGLVSGRTQPIHYQFSTFRFSSFHSSTDVPDNTVQSHPGSDLVLADCIGFGPNESGPEAKIIRPASGQCFPAYPDRMRIRSGMFTGYYLHLQTTPCFCLAIEVATFLFQTLLPFSNGHLLHIQALLQ